MKLKDYLNESKSKSISKAKIGDIIKNVRKDKFYKVVGVSGPRITLDPVVLDKKGNIDYSKSSEKFSYKDQIYIDKSDELDRKDYKVVD